MSLTTGPGLHKPIPGNVISTDSTDTDPVAVSAVSGQTGNLQQWQDKDGNQLLALDVTANLVGNTSAGTQIGTAAAQKLSFWGAAPAAQAVLATGAAHTVDDVIAFLQGLGLCRQA